MAIRAREMHLHEHSRPDRSHASTATPAAGHEVAERDVAGADVHVQALCVHWVRRRRVVSPHLQRDQLAWVGADILFIFLKMAHPLALAPSPHRASPTGPGWSRGEGGEKKTIFVEILAAPPGLP